MLTDNPPGDQLQSARKVQTDFRPDLFARRECLPHQMSAWR